MRIFFETNVFLVAHQKDPNGVDPDVVLMLSSTMAKYDKNLHTHRFRSGQIEC